MKLPTVAELDAILRGLPGGIDSSNQGLQMLLALRNDMAVELQPYHFVLTFANIVAATTAPTAQFFVDSSAPFMLVSQEYVANAYPIAAVPVVPNLMVQIQDQQSNRNWQNAAVPVSSIFGDGKLPYFLPQPRLIAANSNVAVTVNNTDAAVAYTVSLVFSGFRVYG